VCIGARFAVVEALVVLARILRRFRLELVRPRPVVPVGMLTIHPDRSPPFRLRPRDPLARPDAG
jgi:unspecific monooxygenase